MVDLVRSRQLFLLNQHPKDVTSNREGETTRTGWPMATFTRQPDSGTARTPADASVPVSPPSALAAVLAVIGSHR